MWQKCVAIIVTVGFFLGVGSVVWQYRSEFLSSSTASELAEAVKKQDQGDDISLAVLDYLLQPAFSNKDLLEQVCGIQGKLELYDLDESLVYFSLDDDGREARLLLSKLTCRPAKVEWATIVKDRLVLGDYVSTKKNSYFCRFPAKDFRVRPEAEVVIPFDGLTYKVSARELADWLGNETIICGKANFHAYTESGGLEIWLTNFGSWVARSGEASLTRLVGEIIGQETKLERQAQLLLTFVTNQVSYDYQEEDWKSAAQVIRRPVESLLTKRATCASKAVLYVSLLAQLGIDYRLGYYHPDKKHLTVFVAGTYRNRNQYQLELDGRVYSLAEPTCPDFIIGESRLDESKTRVLDDLMWLNKPTTHEFVNYHSGERKIRH